jgi:heme/copper-type cytochrome/quinol oxidase subunit 2
MRSDGPTIDDFPGIGTSRLILSVCVIVLVVSLAVTAVVAVRAARNRRRRGAAEGGHRP